MRNAELAMRLDRIRGELDMIRSDLGEQPTQADIRRLAEQFCAMDDDSQAKFFVEVAKVMDGWPTESHGRDTQCWYIGRHLG